MRIRRALVPLLLTPLALAACGGDSGGTDGGAGGDEDAAGGSSGGPSPSPTQREEPDDLDACAVLSSAQVAAAVGTSVDEGVSSSGPAITGGSFTTCVWRSGEPGGQATLTVYPNAEAADSAREDDAQDLEGIGDKAYSGSFSSVWVYVGERSFFAQWYTIGSLDDEDLPQSQALAEAAADALA